MKKVIFLICLVLSLFLFSNHTQASGLPIECQKHIYGWGAEEVFYKFHGLCDIDPFRSYKVKNMGNDIYKVEINFTFKNQRKKELLYFRAIDDRGTRCVFEPVKN